MSSHPEVEMVTEGVFGDRSVSHEEASSSKPARDASPSKGDK